MPPPPSQRQARRELIAKHRSDRLPITYASAASALQSAFLANGGGAVALLAFYGQLLAAQPHHPAASGLARALLVLVIGVGLAVAATGLSFLAQYGYLLRRNSRLGKFAAHFTWANMALVFASLLCFVVVGAQAYYALACRP